MIEWIVDQWSFGFVRNAFVGSFLLCLAIAPISIFVVKRRLSLAGEALAHGSLPGLIIFFYAFGLSTWLLTLGGFLGAFAIVGIAAFISWRSLFSYDAMMGGIYITFFGIGVFMLSIGSFGLDLNEFLLGDILAFHSGKLRLMLVVTLLSLVSIVFLYRPLVLQTQDPAFFASLYRPAWWVNQAFMVLFVLCLIAAFNAFGTVLAIGITILPALAARCWVNHVPSIMGLSFVLGLTACWVGLCIALVLETVPAGPTMVLVASAIWIFSYLAGPYGLRLSLNSNNG